MARPRKQVSNGRPRSKTIWLRFRPKFFAFAFKHSTFRSPEARQPWSHVLTCDWDKTVLLDHKSASRTRPDETFGTDKSAGQGHINRRSRIIHNRTSKFGLPRWWLFERCVCWRRGRNHGGIFFGRLARSCPSRKFHHRSTGRHTGHRQILARSSVAIIPLVFRGRPTAWYVQHSTSKARISCSCGS